MKARITIHNYNGEIKTLAGEYKKDNSTGQVEIILSDLKFLGQDEGDEGVRLKSNDHLAQLYWKNPWTLHGKWKSTNGDWDKLTVSMKDIKKLHMKDWWGNDDFADIVETSLISYDSTKNITNLMFDNSFRVSNTQLNFIINQGPHFAPFMNNDNNPFKDEDLFDRFKDDDWNGLFLADYTKPLIHTISSCIVHNDNEERLLVFNQNGQQNSIKNIILSALYLKPESIPKGTLVPETFPKKSRSYALYRFSISSDSTSCISKSPCVINFKHNSVGVIFPNWFNKKMKKAVKLGKSDEFFDDLDHNADGDLLFKQGIVCAKTTSELLDINKLVKEKNLWTVVAEEDKCKATFYVDYEQVKSLFRARRSPLTQTGRMKHIKHWVRTHQRYKDEDEEITIPKHLRGTSDIQMGSTNFKLINPLI